MQSSSEESRDITVTCLVSNRFSRAVGRHPMCERASITPHPSLLSFDLRFDCLLNSTTVFVVLCSYDFGFCPVYYMVSSRCGWKLPSGPFVLNWEPQICLKNDLYNKLTCHTGLDLVLTLCICAKNVSDWNTNVDHTRYWQVVSVLLESPNPKTYSMSKNKSVA